LVRTRPDGLGTQGGVVRAEGITRFLCTRSDRALDLYTRNALVVRGAARRPPPSTRHRACPARDIGGVGPGRAGISLGSGVGTGRSEPTRGNLAPRFFARSVEPRPRQKALPNSRAKRAGSGTHRRTARGQRSMGDPDPPWETPTLHEGPRTRDPYGAQPGALNASISSAVAKLALLSAASPGNPLRPEVPRTLPSKHSGG
jgi:hypothetical protein